MDLVKVHQQIYGSNAKFDFGASRGAAPLNTIGKIKYLFRGIGPPLVTSGITQTVSSLMIACSSFLPCAAAAAALASWTSVLTWFIYLSLHSLLPFRSISASMIMSYDTCGEIHGMSTKEACCIISLQVVLVAFQSPSLPLRHHWSKSSYRRPQIHWAIGPSSVEWPPKAW